MKNIGENICTEKQGDKWHSANRCCHTLSGCSWLSEAEETEPLTWFVLILPSFVPSPTQQIQFPSVSTVCSGRLPSSCLRRQRRNLFHTQTCTQSSHAACPLAVFEFMEIISGEGSLNKVEMLSWSRTHTDLNAAVTVCANAAIMKMLTDEVTVANWLKACELCHQGPVAVSVFKWKWQLVSSPQISSEERLLVQSEGNLFSRSKNGIHFPPLVSCFDISQQTEGSRIWRNFGPGDRHPGGLWVATLSRCLDGECGST